MADSSSLFGGSCGKCFEVRCKPGIIYDGYGDSHDRSSACYDPSKSLVVRTVDNCPCVYPGNQFSNSRWCCGDNGYTAHLDLSVWAFEKLASKTNGMIGLEIREVSCDYQSSNPAPSSPDGTSPAEPGRPRADEITASLDTIYVKRFDDVGATQGGFQPIKQEEIPVYEDRGIVKGSSIFSSATASAFTTASSEVVTDSSCTDTQPDEYWTCQQQKDFGACEQSFMIDGNFCLKTCGRCSDSTTASSEAATDSSCTDTQPDEYWTCQQQKDFGACEQGFMIDGNFCLKTCGRCSDSTTASSEAVTDSSCTDTQPDEYWTCQQQKDFGACEQSFMIDGNFCLKTCGRCSDSTTASSEAATDSSCTDTQPDEYWTCQQQKDFGACEQSFMIDGNFCLKTCGRC